MYLIKQVQGHLERIYGIEAESQASEYLLDETAAKQLGGTCRAEEELLVYEQGAELEVGLYFSSGLLNRMRAFEGAPPESLLDEDLSSYCQVAEGVSHFLYLSHTASMDRQVSLLELEAQAEVDKFATCALLRWSEGLDWVESLRERLFERVSYNASLEPHERWRYEEANRLANQYCGRLVPLFSSRRMDRLLGELRYSYRLGAEAKLRYLGG